MKYYLLFLFFLATQISPAQIEFKSHFTNDALRIDFLLAGDSQEEEIYLQHMKKEPVWAGPRNHLITPMQYGNYAVRVEDLKGELIYMRGFSTLFEEWVTTEKARTTQKAFQQTIRVPFPREKVQVKIQKRLYETGQFQDILKRTVDPDDYFILEEEGPDVSYEKIHAAGKPENSVDLVFLGEGYRKQEMDKFEKDVQYMMDYFFSLEPVKKYKNRINVYRVNAVSEESGTDVPGEAIYSNTVFNSSYYTFDIPRYLTTFSTWKMRDYAAVVPYDHIILLINTERYGGGGFYNHFTASTVGHLYSDKVAIHEFGHGFAGLGDEYYSSNVPYSEFYNLEVEPWEPNITTLVDFDSKWKEMIQSEVPVPTPRKAKYSDTIGAFEGGGYVSKGIYSPYMDCRMKSNISPGFCPVCQRSIETMILYYLGELQ